RAAHAERMAQGDGASVDINPFVVIWQPERARTSQHLGCKGLVDFDDAHIFQLESGPLEREARGSDRTDAHDAGLDTHYTRGYDARDRLQSLLPDGQFRSDEQGSRSVIES